MKKLLGNIFFILKIYTTVRIYNVLYLLKILNLESINKQITMIKK